MKIFEGNGEGGLTGITEAGREAWLPLRTTDDVFVSEGNEIYVVVRGGEQSTWKLEDGTRVELYNTHCTGELRWNEQPYYLSPSGFLAVRHFGLHPADLADDEWQSILGQHLVNLKDLPEVAQRMLENAAEDPDGCASFEENWKEGFAPERAAMYDLYHKGLVNIGATAGSGSRVKKSYHITSKGRELLKNGHA